MEAIPLSFFVQKNGKGRNLCMEEFIKTMRELLELQLEGCKVENIEVQKNNGVLLRGVRIVKKETNISPTFYLESYYQRYEEGENMNNLVDDLMNCYFYAEKEKPKGVDEFMDFEIAKERIVFKIINLPQNSKLLLDTPHQAFLDLAVVYYYICESKERAKATILIKNEHLQLWGISPDDIFSIAIQNTPRILKASIKGMESVISEMLVPEEKRNINVELSKHEDMYVLTNEYGIFGAAVILYHKILDEFAEFLEYDFYILPSSVHEVLVVPKRKNLEVERLRKMVREVNETEVAREEILSDQVYFYSRKNHEFSIA